MAEVIVIGGGLAGLATAAALGGAGHSVKVLESRPFLGGRAASYEVGNGRKPSSSTTASTSCCAAASACWILSAPGSGARHRLLARVHFHRAGRAAQCAASGSCRRQRISRIVSEAEFSEFRREAGGGRAMQAIPARLILQKGALISTASACSTGSRKAPAARAIERYWRRVLVSAINEELDPHGCRAWPASVPPDFSRERRTKWECRRAARPTLWERNVEAHRQC